MQPEIHIFSLSSAESICQQLSQQAIEIGICHIGNGHQMTVVIDADLRARVSSWYLYFEMWFSYIDHVWFHLPNMRPFRIDLINQRGAIQRRRKMGIKNGCTKALSRPEAARSFLYHAGNPTFLLLRKFDVTAGRTFTFFKIQHKIV